MDQLLHRLNSYLFAILRFPTEVELEPSNRRVRATTHSRDRTQPGCKRVELIERNEYFQVTERRHCYQLADILEVFEIFRYLQGKRRRRSAQPLHHFRTHAERRVKGPSQVLIQ